jgi:uncharacterized protein with FMN-binding domain
MRRILFWFMSTISAVVLMFSYHTSTNSIAAAAPVQPVTPDNTTTTVDNAAEAPSASSTTKSTSGTYSGSRANTRWGIVQVQITVKNGKITSSQAIEYPNNNGRDQQINAYALPILSQEAISAQSANIDSISGATVTTNGYRSSLQSAIDQAHL